MLNYMTAPNVTILSAIRASSSIPGLFAPARLYIKNEKGKVVPRDDHQTYVDGSVRMVSQSRFGVVAPRASQTAHCHSLSVAGHSHREPESHAELQLHRIGPKQPPHRSLHLQRPLVSGTAAHVAKHLQPEGRPLLELPRIPHQGDHLFAREALGHLGQVHFTARDCRPNARDRCRTDCEAESAAIHEREWLDRNQKTKSWHGLPLTSVVVAGVAAAALS